MNCIWRYTWYDHFLSHGWLFWLLVVAAVAVTLFFLLNRRQKKQQLRCSGCNSLVEAVYLRCPECGQELKSHCPGCSHIVENSWQFCPYCKETLQSGTACPDWKRDAPTP
jgi:predicted amidophosphoribosyltransferase